MTEPVPQEWPEVALSYLDALWATDTHMAVIRKKLMPLLGFYPMSADVIAMARRYVGKPVKIVAAPVPIEVPVSLTFGFGPVPKVDNPVRLVPPESFPVPVGGFSMLGGKSR